MLSLFFFSAVYISEAVDKWSPQLNFFIVGTNIFYLAGFPACGLSYLGKSEKKTVMKIFVQFQRNNFLKL